MKWKLILLVWTLALAPIWGQESNIHLAAGAGLSVRFDDHEEFEVKEIDHTEYLVVRNDSHIRPVAMAGVMMQVKSSWYAVINLGFSEGGRLVDDVFLGAGIKAGDYAIFTAGYSVRLGKELSPEFRKKTKNYVQGENLSEKYDGYEIRKCGFKGAPIIDSVNSSVIFGVMVPVQLFPEGKEQFSP